MISIIINSGPLGVGAFGKRHIQNDEKLQKGKVY
jgi:hypothetical protein